MRKPIHKIWWAWVLLILFFIMSVSIHSYKKSNRQGHGLNMREDYRISYSKNWRV
ncbi:hypothetical protein HMPREF3189_00369 [Clostridiales bacterium KA00134]|nr:hypothetical protein HMPREF3189_00369 [Clostridiales bacterium KA00134]